MHSTFSRPFKLLPLFSLFLLCLPLYPQTVFPPPFLQDNELRSTNLLNLQEQAGSVSVIADGELTATSFSFPLESYDAFRNALRSFLTAKTSQLSSPEPENRDTFFDYRVHHESLTGRLQVSIGGGIDYHSDGAYSYLHPYRKVRLTTNFNNRLLLWGEWWAGRFQGDEPSLDYAEATSPLITGWYKSHRNDGQKHTNLNSLTGEIAYLFDYARITVGRDNHLIGQNIAGSIILNDAANQYGYFGSELLFGRLQLSFLHANLIAANRNLNPDIGTIHNVDKYLVLHQLDWQPTNSFSLFFGEMIIYGNRTPDLSYFLPHTFYRITEHNLGDRDNVLIYGGGELHLLHNETGLLSVYGTILLDELRKSELFGDWWGNKYALQGGITANYLPGLIDNRNRHISTTFEMTAVRPWMYTHKTVYTCYSHNGIGLGFPEGSNLIQTAAEIGIPLLPYLRIDQFASFTRQGSLGNSWHLHYDNDRKDEQGEFIDTAPWLAGELTATFTYKGVVSFSWFRHHTLKIGIQWLKEDDRDPQREFVLSYGFAY